MSTQTGEVVIGYDGSADSERALDWADQLAAEQGRALRVLISEVDLSSVMEVTADWHDTRIRELQEDARLRLASARTHTHSVEVVSDPAAEALVGASEKASTVVLGARGHSAVSGVLLGSVSQQVARRASCPVVVVREAKNPGSDRIVVGVDGSPSSRKALELAFEHADRTGAPVVAVHAWHERFVRRETEEGLAEEISDAERLLEEALAGLAGQYPDVRVSTETIPVAPQRVLVDASESAALVVVGSRGRGALAGLALGSVSQSVLHHAQCAVVVVR
jgi:nucleotide-binding universal stress UspA family protein